LLYLLEYLEGSQTTPKFPKGDFNTRSKEYLKRVFLRENDEVVYYNGAKETDVAQKDTGNA
jgi:hypothetical protein